jgi:hypothetical protein
MSHAVFKHARARAHANSLSVGRDQLIRHMSKARERTGTPLS